MMTAYGDSSGSGWLMWGLGGIVLVGLVILAVLVVSRSQRRDI
jgi:hypothetical protein